MESTYVAEARESHLSQTFPTNGNLDGLATQVCPSTQVYVWLLWTEDTNIGWVIMRLQRQWEGTWVGIHGLWAVTGALLQAPKNISKYFQSHL